MARNDSAAAERIAHTVKGVAGNLGAGPIQQLAGKVEKAIATKAPSNELTPLLGELGSALDTFVSALRSALPAVEAGASAAAATVPLDSARAKEVVQTMVQYLNNFDPAAGECLEANRDIFRALLADGKFARFEQHVSGFAFADALAALEPAAKEKGLLPA